MALLVFVMTVGPAALAPAQTEASGAVLLILDASGSMDRVDDSGTRLIDGAKNALREIVERLPTDANVGLRVYGHRTSNDDPVAGCVDTELVVPVGPIDREALYAAIDSFDAGGFTPIGLSLQEAAADLPDTGSRTIILISDGIDTCAPPDPCEVAEQLAVEGFVTQIHTVGFFLNDQAAADQLQCIAEVGRGTFTQIDDVERLTIELGGLVTDAVEGRLHPIVQGALTMELAPVIPWQGPYNVAWLALEAFLEGTINTGETRWWGFDVTEEHAGDHHLLVTAVIDRQPGDLVDEYLEIQIFNQDGNPIGVPYAVFDVPVLSPQRLDLVEQARYTDMPSVEAVTGPRSAPPAWETEDPDEPWIASMHARFYAEGLNGGQFGFWQRAEDDPPLPAGRYFVAVTWTSSRTASSRLEVGATLHPADGYGWVRDRPQRSLVTRYQPGDEPSRQQLEMVAWEGDGPAGVPVPPARSIEVLSAIDVDEPRSFGFALEGGERLAVGVTVGFAETYGGARIDLDLVHESGSIARSLEVEDTNGWLEGYDQQSVWEASLDGQYILTVGIRPDSPHSDPAVLLAVFVFPAKVARALPASELPAEVATALMSGLRSVREFVAGSG